MKKSRFRDECLNTHLFRNLSEAREIIGEYIQWFNSKRLHSGLDYRTPNELFEGEMYGLND
ncbi:MAG: integrase core domain-containing protein [Vulcanimicrobiota bacterium]